MVRTIISLSRRQKSIILWTLETACVPVAFMATLVLLLEFPTAPPPMNQIMVQIGVLTAVSGMLSLLSGVHRLRLMEFDRMALTMTAVQALLLAAMNAAMLAFLPAPNPPGFSVMLGSVLFAMWFASRNAALVLLQALYRRSGAITRVVVYGAGRTGMSLMTALRLRSDIVAVGFVDDNIALRGTSLMGIPVYSFVEIGKLLDDRKVDRVILAVSGMSPEKEIWVTRRLAALGVEVQALPAFAQLIGEGDLLAKLRRTDIGSLMNRQEVRRMASEGLGEYRGANVLVTGAGGSIGIELCRQVLACSPARLVLFELSELALYSAEKELSQRAEGSPTQIVSVLGSVEDARLVETVLRENAVDTVLHAAAYKHVPIVEENPRAGLANNALGTAVIAQVARDCGVGRFVLVSTDKAVRPANIMGASKRFAELAVQDLATRSQKTRFAIVRFGNVLGSSGSVVPRFTEQIERGGPVTLTHPDVRRFFMTIEEASHLVLIAGSLSRGGDVFVLDMGEQIPIGELARRLIENAGFTVRDAANPGGDIEIVVTGLRPGEKLYEELTIGDRAEPTVHPKIIRVREDHLSQIEMAAALRDVREAVAQGDDAALRAVVHRWIPECTAPLAAEHAAIGKTPAAPGPTRPPRAAVKPVSS